MTDIGLDVRVQFAETREIGVFKQYLGGRIHAFEVGTKKQARGKMAQEGLLAHIHIIMVSSGRGIKARVGRRRHLPQIRHGNIGRQQAIEFIDHPL